MQEDFLHYIWKMQLYDTSSLETSGGESLRIINRGIHNPHAGPDFLNARIRIDGTLWAGNVEIHTRSSEWTRHGHSADPAYDNVILHVVHEDDEPVPGIPTLILKDRIPPGLISTYAFLMHTASQIPCERNIHITSPPAWKKQLDAVLLGRLGEKALLAEQRLQANRNDWEETCYQLFARNFGALVNCDPFEHVARSLPLKILTKHRNRPFQAEALLFGQAGFLEGGFRELYPHRLQVEYRYLKKKYGLENIRPVEWKFLRLRPANFPTLRMSQLAAFITKHEHVFSRIRSIRNVKEIRSLFEVEAADFWKEHYHFRKAVPLKSAMLGKETADRIIINAISPLLFLYGKRNGDPGCIQRAVDFLKELPPENNACIRAWKKLGVEPVNAGESQALLHQKSNYCDRKRCLECAVGQSILKSQGNLKNL